MRTAGKPVRGRLGVVTKNIVSLRKDPDGDTERVTQALIGEPVVAEGGQGEWLFVQTWDTYRGWIPAHSVRLLDASHSERSEESALQPTKKQIPRDARNDYNSDARNDYGRPYASSGNVAIIRELFVEVLEEPRDGSMIVTRAPISAEIEVAGTSGEWVELRLPDGRAGFIRNREARLVDRDIAQTIPLPDPKKLVETAMRFIGTPYLWGGTSPFGIDCSGFVQLIHRIHGVTLLRDAHMQAGDERGVPVEKEKLRAGDLVFFGKHREGEAPAEPRFGRSLTLPVRFGRSLDLPVSTVTHIGMAIDGKRFIHSSGHSGVIVSPFTDELCGPKYWGARRMRFSTLDPGGGAPED